MKLTFGGNQNHDYQVGKTIELGPIGSIVLGFIFIVIGIILTIFMLNMNKDYKEKNKTFIETTAVVVDNEYNISDEIYTPIIEYKVDGKNYKSELKTSSSVKKSLGTEVKIKYNPSNPSDFIEPSDSLNFIFIIVGVGFAVIGVIVIVINIGKLGKIKEQIQEFTEQLYNNDIDNLYGKPAEINSTITYDSENKK